MMRDRRIPKKAQPRVMVRPSRIGRRIKAEAFIPNAQPRCGRTYQSAANQSPANTTASAADITGRVLRFTTAWASHSCSSMKAAVEAKISAAMMIGGGARRGRGTSGSSRSKAR